MPTDEVCGEQRHPGRYPTDDGEHNQFEQERLDIDHETMLLITNGALYKAPIKNPHRVLDMGTGTGIWATDFANDHPESEVIGMDLRCVVSHQTRAYQVNVFLAICCRKREYLVPLRHGFAQKTFERTPRYF